MTRQKSDIEDSSIFGVRIAECDSKCAEKSHQLDKIRRCDQDDTCYSEADDALEHSQIRRSESHEHSDAWRPEFLRIRLKALAIWILKIL